MSNQIRPKPALKAGFLVRGLSLLLVLALAASCSIVFRSSIQGTVIDREDWAAGTTTGVADAKVFLYTDVAARNADYDAYADGDETSLPDGAAKAEYGYFQSTVADADGGYDFTGFIWEKLFSEYGKTADRAEVHLLIYHPDYGLWKNPVPLYVVSDVTNQLPQITIEDLWNQGRLAGTVLDWKDDEGLGNVAVNFYVAESWTYAADGSFENIEYPRTATATTTTDDNGAWAATMRFPMKPSRTAHATYNNAPVRVSYVRENYRANDPADGTGLDTLNNTANLVVTEDRDNDGVTAEGKKPDGTAASFYDYEDAFVVETLTYDDDEGEAILKTAADITMQRWRFSTTVQGRVSDGAAPATRVYFNGIEVKLTAPAPGGIVYRDITGSQTIGETTTDGHFNLGTLTWKISDVADLTGDVGNVVGIIDEQKSGKIAIEVKADDVVVLTVNGGKNRLEPDVSLTMELIVP